MMREAIETALEKFRPQFKGDGSDLVLGSIDPRGVVEVQIPLVRVAVRQVKMY